MGRMGRSRERERGRLLQEGQERSVRGLPAHSGNWFVLLVYAASLASSLLLLSCLGLSPLSSFSHSSLPHSLPLTLPLFLFFTSLHLVYSEVPVHSLPPSYSISYLSSSFSPPPTHTHSVFSSSSSPSSFSLSLTPRTSPLLKNLTYC